MGDISGARERLHNALNEAASEGELGACSMVTGFVCFVEGLDAEGQWTMARLHPLSQPFTMTLGQASYLYSLVEEEAVGNQEYDDG